MNTRVFFVSDTHFGHNNICKFTTETGEKLRPWDNASEMDEAMVELWNGVVREQDKVYHLGDVVMSKKHLSTLGKLNGKKVLIKGNHDIFKPNEYLEYFKDIRGYHVLAGMILSHVPIHPSSLERFSVNLHGHLHSNRVMLDGKIDPRYFSVCVEQIGFMPIQLEDLIERIKQQGGSTEMKPRFRDNCPS